MKIVFLGVGSACDENYPNNSQVIISDKINLLLDCGYSVPVQLWKYNSDPNFLDAIYISHQHADHYFGLPIILERMRESDRKKDITIICQKELKDFFYDFMDIAYKDFVKTYGYKINFLEAEEGADVNLDDLKLSFQESIHSRENLAVKIINDDRSMVYSGDGTPERGNFYKNTDLLIQETYLYDQEKEGHMSIVGAIKFAEENNVKCLALAHINRNVRKNDLPGLVDKIKSDKVKIIIPEPLEEYKL